MKLISLLLLTVCWAKVVQAYTPGITLSEKNAPLQKIFRQIKAQTGYDFVYENKFLQQARKVTIEVKNATLEQVMEICFKDQLLTWQLVGNIVVVKQKPATPNTVQQVIPPPGIDVKGRVITATGEPVESATVAVKGTSIGTRCNAQGFFELINLEKNAVLVVSAANIQTQEVKLAGQTSLVIVAGILVKQEEEVTVNAGYYRVHREEATGSIGRVDAKVIEKQPVTNPIAAIAGRIPGVFTQQTTGVPGGDFKIQIRGRNSLRDDGNEPLYIVDGVPFSSDKISSARYNAVGIIPGGTSPLTSINPADIAAIEILKDADATAIYGSRGANGVVLITTKKGKPGKTKFDINAYSGQSWVHRISLLNTQQYLDMRREAYANDQLIPTADPDDNRGINGKGYAPDLTIWDANAYTDWQKVFLGNPSATTSMQAALSGGSENTQFLFSGGYYRETSVFPGHFSFRKFSSLLSVKHRSLNRKFNISASVSGSVDQNDQPQADYSGQAIGIAPNAPALYNSDGSLNWAPHPVTGQSTWTNPMADFERIFESNTFNVVANTAASYTILTGLELSVTLGYNRMESREISILPSTWFDPAYGYGSERSSVNNSNGTVQTWSLEPQVNWEKKIAKGQLTVLAGVSYQYRNFQRIAHSYSDFPSNRLLRDVSAAAFQSIWENVLSEYKYAAVFGRINYNWDGRYIINLTGRRDGSSRFGSGKQYANFGAVGAAWIFSKTILVSELFPYVSFGKLRGSYGITGSDQIGDYQYLDTYSTAGGTNTSYDGVTALDPSRLYNANFSWESNKKLEAALELGFLNDRILLTGAWYRNRSSNQLVQYSLPRTTGFGGILANLPATVQNTGVEIELSTTNIRNKHFSWTSSLNITIPRNKLISFPGIDSSSYANRYMVGQSIYVQRFYHFKGVDPQTGFYTFEDYNQDGAINSPADDLYLSFIGQDMFAGLNNSFSYKNITLDFFFQAVKQTGRLTTFGAGRMGLNLPGYFAGQQRWQKPGDVVPFQRYATEYVQGLGASANNSPYEKYVTSDGIITDASFIRLKTVSLAWRLPSQWIKGMNGQIYARGQNLLLLTGYKGSDPETQSVFILPPLRTITVGINITL